MALDLKSNNFTQYWHTGCPLNMQVLVVLFQKSLHSKNGIYFISLSVLYLQLQIWRSCSSCLQDQQSTNWNRMMTKRYVGTDCLKAIKFQILTFLLLILSAMYLKLRYHTSLLLYPAFRITRFPLYKRNEDHSPILASALPWNVKTLQEAKPVNALLIKASQ